MYSLLRTQSLFARLAIVFFVTFTWAILVPEVSGQDMTCVVPGDAYQEPAQGLSEVNLGFVTITPAETAAGGLVPLNVVDCSGDGLLDVEIPWSEESAIQHAMIGISSNVCRGDPPEVIEVVLRHGNSCTLEGLNSRGVVVDTEIAGDHSFPQSLILRSDGGIRAVRVIGSEICLLRMCIACSCNSEGGCRQATSVFWQPTQGVPEVALGWATISQAITPSGDPVPLNLSDCSQDGKLDVIIPWSETGAKQQAMIQVSERICCGNAPMGVTLTLQLGNACTVNAYDHAGNLVDSKTVPPGPPSKEVAFSSSSGIRSLRFFGSEICLQEICWQCQVDITSTPTPSPTPLPDLLWVDANNQSGIEDGSEQYPFDTIAEAMMVAVTHTIQVRGGVYSENVQLKDGVKLIGEGYETTTIEGSIGPKGPGDPGITCQGVGPESIVAGFTITGVSTGIYCDSSSPQIRENFITNIALESLAGDGIRLENSSPLIQNNVICHVGGMGIRAQGNSDPDIVNNSIYDFGYYAGISFAALDIGPVTPVIKNNIIMRGNDLPVGGILWNATATPDLSYNNVFDPADVTGGGSFYAQHSGTGWVEMPGGPGAISEDPMFLAPENCALQLDPLSPCIDAGDPAVEYNDTDGSRNDMGAFGGNRLDIGAIHHPGGGFLFTSVGKIAVTEIDQNPANDTFGLARVSPTAAADYHIPEYRDAPFGGYLWIRGLFGMSDDVDYYQIVATPEIGSGSFTLNDPLTKSKYKIGPGGTVTATHVRLGPNPIGGVPDLYELNKGGYWSQQDLRIIWNTTGLNGRYRLDYKAYKKVSDTSVTQVNLPPNTQDRLTLWLDGNGVSVQINDVLYADHTPIEECQDIVFPHVGSSELIFNITAHHPGGFLRYYILDCYWGHDHYGGRFDYDQYVGSHDATPPLWEGPLDVELPPMLPVNAMGDPVPWENCAYRFRLAAGARTTDGYGYLRYGSYSVYHSVETVPPKSDQIVSSAPCVNCPPMEDPGSSPPALEIAPLEPIPAPKIPIPVAKERPKGVPPVEIWVDDDNTSGIEDGSPTNPYNTIGEGIAAGTSGDTVRVMPGLYLEQVDLTDGVHVIGAGADDTVIDGVGANWAVECNGIGAGTLFSGFTITNASTGIYCHSSELSLRENIITGIYGGTSGDGIRMDDSSPLIQNNLIYNVDGMGIRAQGNSEGQFINNTIFDYRYYAGISFASLNIGPGSPVIKNNIVMRGNDQPVGGILWNAISTPAIAYNDVFGPANVTGGGSFYAMQNGTTWVEVPGGPGAISEDPQFIDPDHGYFYLDALSPCVDAGDQNPIYNDNDGTRNDMGAYGGQRLESGATGHPGTGFIFTGIGKIPITEIVANPMDLSHGLFRVSDTVANDLHIHKFTDAPLGGGAWLHGLFGMSDDVDYYQVVAAPYGTSATDTLDDPLVKTLFTINPDGTVDSTRVEMGPQSIGGVDNLYLLNKEGYWSFTDLRLIWNTTGLSGKYTVSYKAYRLTSPDSVVEVPLPRNDLDHFTVMVNNEPVQAQIEEITYADGTPILECEKIAMPHESDSSLIFTITARHAAGYLRSYHLNCFWGNNRYGGLFTADQYEGAHDAPPPLWEGVLHHTLPPLLPMIGGSVEPWYTCAYHFHLEGTARITDGVHYLKWSQDNIYQSVDAGIAPITPHPTPSETPVLIPTDTAIPTPTDTATPTPTQTSVMGDFAYMVAHFPVEPVLVAIHPLLTEDISVHGIEITQGIQCFNTGAGLASCPDNSMPMVTNKTTTARIYMDYSHSLLPIGARDNVPAKIYLRWNGGIWVSTIATGKAKSTLDQSHAANSANVDFYVNTGLNSGVLDYYVEVDPNDVIDETNEANNRYPATGHLSIDFFKREQSDSVGRLLRYHPAGYTGPQYAGGFPMNWCVGGGASDWQNLIMPISDNGIDYSIHSGYLDWTDSLGTGDGQHLLIEHLNTMWVLENYFSFWFAGEFTGAEHVYGWVPYNTSNWGHADMPAYPHAGGLGVVAIGTDEDGNSLDDPGPGALIYGHELTHTYDVFHTDTGADDCGANDSSSDFPYGTSSIQEFGYNPLTGEVYNPADTHDLMSYCPAGGSKRGWIAPFTWNKMFNLLDTKKISQKVLKSTEIATPYVLYKTAGEASLMVNATVFNPDYQGGQILGELGPLYRGDLGNTLVLPQGDYAIEMRDGSNVLARHSFAVNFKSQFSGQPDLSRMDAAMIIPWVEGTTTVALLHNSDVLDQRVQSSNDPTVNITDPSAAASWPAGSTQTLAWTGEDLDGDTLSYSIFFSHNGGANWELLTMESQETAYEVAVDSVAGGTDVRFRVVATDGINVGFDENDAPIEIPNKEPMAIIANPTDGDHFLPGGLILFQGSGTDLEDGELPGSGLEWSSDLQGTLGSGYILPATGLEPGLHVVTLTVTDSNGQTGEDHVFITVKSEEMLLVDQNSDGLINHEDLLEILSHWDESLEKGYPPCKADLNADGVVDDNDLFDFGRFYQANE